MFHGWNRRLRGRAASARRARPELERLEARHALTTAPVFAVLGDGLADTYAASPDSNGASSWLELLAAEQRVSFGARATEPVAAWGPYRTQGYEYVWSVPMPLPADARASLLGAVDTDAIDYVVIGFTQHALASRAAEISAGTLQGDGLARWIDSVVEQTLQAADAVLATGRAQVALVAFDDPTLLPAYKTQFPATAGLQRLHAAAVAANSRLFAAADSRYLPVVDLRNIAELAGAAAPPSVGGVSLDVSLPPQNSQPADDLFLDGLRLGAIPSGLLANSFVDAVVRAFDAQIEPLSDQEILARAGLVVPVEATATYFDVSPFVHFDALPIAGNDVASVRERVPTVIPLFANDVDPEGRPLVLRNVTPPQNGALLSFADGRITYQSNIGFEGVDWFWYEVSDGRDRTTRARIDVAVLNAPPVIRSFAVPAVAVPGQPLEMTARFTDAGTTDEHRASWQWGDGTSSDGTITKSDGSGNVNDVKAFTAIGTYRVGLTVVDDGGGSASREQAVTVRQVTIGAAFGRSNTLLVGGTPGDDLIQVRQLGTRTISVRMGGREVASYPLSSVSAIAVYGQAGNDILTLENVTLPALLDGGTGKDYVLGGTAADVIVGGDGDDTLYGGPGQNFIVGGAGSDTVIGNRGEDLLVASATAYDSRASSLAGLLAEWSRTDLAYEGRVAHLRLGGGRNGANVLDSGTVLRETTTNKLQGGEGRDWYFARLARVGTSVVDQLLGRTALEWVEASGWA